MDADVEPALPQTGSPAKATVPDEDIAEYSSSDDDGSSFVDELLEETLCQGVEAGDEPPAKKSKSEADAAVPDDPEHIVTKKIVLKKRNADYFEVLPEGWIEVTHFSGMPLYLHRVSRVCSASKPYFLGSGSVRKHDIPISAIPCLQYRNQLAKEQAVQSADEVPDAGASSSGAACNGTESQPKKMNVKVESVEESKKKNSLPYLQVREYCSKLFEFQEIIIRKFKTWADRRQHTANRKMKERPSLPEGTKLITCPITNWNESGITAENGSDGVRKANTGARNQKREFVMNPKGKTHICILHEFIQHSERVQPHYDIKELENAATPYSATVEINGTKYGTGFGTSKKIAKSEAARKTLEILIPTYSSQVDIEKAVDNPQGENPAESSLSQELEFFDQIGIRDNRVANLCVTAGQFSPYQVLVECLKRNHGLGDTDISFNVTPQKGNKPKNQYTMTAGKHTVSGICKNKIDGKQTASQEILSKLHPQVNSWGALLRLYGRGSCKTPKEKKEEEQKITELQSTACANKPNYAILEKLKSEMEKLHAEKVWTCVTHLLLPYMMFFLFNTKCLTTGESD
jgi:microprocessor complex subunit DGCR8